MQTVITNSSSATQKLGGDLAKDILKRGAKKQALVLGLTGNLGGGKTTFMQGFAKGLGIKDKILSPTFVIMKHFGNFYHIDCYRINKPEEILELGFEKIIADPKNIVAVEWPEKIKKFLPQDTIYIGFEFIDDNTRKITYN
jgi:tRNA threonylcarbamoyladenosine biosynthesis protein TsaE